MKNFRIYSIFAVAISMVFCISCTTEDDLQLQEQNIIQDNLEEIQVIDGRMYFPNITTFQSYYKETKNKEDDDIADLLQDKFYSKDFYSLIPIVNDRTEQQQITRHLENILGNSANNTYQRNSTVDDDLLENFDDIEEMFGEEVYASFLNQDAEIYIGDTIYKYTDVGLFKVKDSDIEHLNNYLDDKEISKNLLEPTDTANRVQYIEENNPCGGMVLVYDELDFSFGYYLAENTGCYGGGTGGGSGSGGTSTVPVPDTPYGLIASGLEECEGERPWLGNLFGQTFVCIDKYDSNHRVKVKFYNLDLGLFYAIGYKVKHQKKGLFGLWFKQNTDEIALGLNAITWKYNIIAPDFSIFQTQNARYYLPDGRMFESLTGYYDAYYAGNVPIPELPFQGLDIIIEIATGTPYSPLENADDVKEFFYEQLYDTAKDILRQYQNKNLKKAGVIIATPYTTWVQEFNFDYACENCSKLEDSIDIGGTSPLFTYTFGTGSGFGGGNWNISLGDLDFNNPDAISLDGYGMANKSGNWYGRRMVFSE